MIKENTKTILYEPPFDSGTGESHNTRNGELSPQKNLFYAGFLWGMLTSGFIILGSYLWSKWI